MERKVWRRPRTEVQKFEANEYVAACHDWNTVYKFKCDAGGGASGNVYQDTNGNGEYDFLVDKELTGWILQSYHACGKEHEAPTDDEFFHGFYRPFGTLNYQQVIIWTDGGTNIHCTTNLNQDSWETAKS